MWWLTAGANAVWSSSRALTWSMSSWVSRTRLMRVTPRERRTGNGVVEEFRLEHGATVDHHAALAGQFHQHATAVADAHGGQAEIGAVAGLVEGRPEGEHQARDEGGHRSGPGESPSLHIGKQWDGGEQGVEADEPPRDGWDLELGSGPVGHPADHVTHGDAGDGRQTGKGACQGRDQERQGGLEEGGDERGGDEGFEPGALQTMAQGLTWPKCHATSGRVMR